jgi:hypothetical protein
MPCDKLILLSHRIRRPFLRWARRCPPLGRYAHVVSADSEDWDFPVRLYCDGFHNGIHKLEFVGVARLGLARTQEILKEILGDISRVTITRVDWCVDLEVPFWQLARSIQVARVQNFAAYRSRLGSSIYPQRSNQKAILLYERLKLLRSRRDPLADAFSRDEHLTRLEVQLRGKGVPIRRFLDIRKYGEIDLLSGMRFRKIKTRARLTPVERLAAEALDARAREIGLQGVSKDFTASEWANLKEKLLEPVPRSDFPDIPRLFRESIEDWLEDRLRFPRVESASSNRLRIQRGELCTNN